MESKRLKDYQIEELDQQLKQRFSDLDIITTNGYRTLLICGGKHLETWRIRIEENGLIFRRSWDLHDDLILLANDIRKEYFNVI